MKTCCLFSSKCQLQPKLLLVWCCCIDDDDDDETSTANLYSQWRTERKRGRRERESFHKPFSAKLWRLNNGPQAEESCSEFLFRVWAAMAQSSEFKVCSQCSSKSLNSNSNSNSNSSWGEQINWQIGVGSCRRWATLAVKCVPTGNNLKLNSN